MRTRLSGPSLIALALCCVCCVAASAEAEASRRASAVTPRTHAPCVAEWTVMVFMNGDNDLEDDLIDDFLEMAKVKDSSLVNVVVQLDRFIGDGGFGEWTHTLRFKIRKDLKPLPEEAIKGFCPESNMGDPRTLTEFVSWAKGAYPAKRYMLIISDHGDGWRRLHTVALQNSLPGTTASHVADLNAGAPQMRSSETESIPHVPLDQIIDAPYRSISEDVTNGDRLFMREVQGALEGLFTRGEKLDVLGFDACLMEMVENGFAMRRVADVMVGSEELEPDAGWQYDDWLGQLVDNPLMDAESLGGVLVRSYEKTYTSTTPMPETTLSAVNLSRGEMEALARSISALARELIVSLGRSELANIRAARRECTAFAPRSAYHGIDLYRFCEQLSQRTRRRPLREKAQAVMRILRRVIITRYAGSARLGMFGSHGIAIYFPVNKAIFMTDPFREAYIEDSPVEHPVEFVQRHLWDNFLQEYYKLVR